MKWDRKKRREEREKAKKKKKKKQKKKKMNVTVIPIVIDALGTVTKGLLQGLEDLEIRGLGNKRTCGGHSNYSIAEMGQNIEESPEDKRRLAVIQTRIKNYQLTLV